MIAATDLQLHPACEALPELPPERYAELVDSIREHGQEDPIILHDGMVLDGRHRLRACEEAGVEPRFEEWDGRGDTPVGFIALKQIRRDMTVSQRAAWAAEYVLPAEEEKAKLVTAVIENDTSAALRKLGSVTLELAAIIDELSMPERGRVDLQALFRERGATS